MGASLYWQPTVTLFIVLSNVWPGEDQRVPGEHLVHPDELLVGHLLDQPPVLHQPGGPGGEVDGGAGVPPHVVRRLPWQIT